MDKALTVGRLAEMTGLSRKAIRYYEQEKLIPKAGRTPSGYRHYNSKVIKRLKFIQKAKSIGFHLEDIRRILNITDKGEPCCDQVYEWSERRLSELDEQIRLLTGLKEKIVRYRKEWEGKKTSSSIPEAEICELIATVDFKENE